MSTKGLAASLFSRTRRSVLRELVLSGKESVHLRELARRAGLDPKGVKRELVNLCGSGIVIEKKSGNQKMYSLNEDSPIFIELKILIQKTVGIADLLRVALMPFNKRINLAYIYGSYAKGTDDSESDIDLLVVSDLSLKEISGVISEVSRKLSRVVNPIVLGLSEYNKKKSDDEGFIKRISSGEKIMLLEGGNDA